MIVKYVTVDGHRWRVRAEGSGLPLLLLHGFTGSSQAWQSIVPSFSEHFCVVTVDFLGHGESDAPADPIAYSMATSIRALMRIMMEFTDDSFSVAGYSMGGRVALGLACTHPRAVRSLVLESTSPGLRTESERSARRDSDEALATRLITHGIRTFVDEWESISLFASQKELPRAVLEIQRERRLKQRPEGLAGSLRGLGTGMQPSLWGELGNLSMPTLILAGEKDEKYVSIAREMKSFMPHAECHTVQGVGHAVHFESPQLYTSLVGDFLRRTSNL